jgi:hypothetical protein
MRSLFVEVYRHQLNGMLNHHLNRIQITPNTSFFCFVDGIGRDRMLKPKIVAAAFNFQTFSSCWYELPVTPNNIAESYTFEVESEIIQHRKNIQ